MGDILQTEYYQDHHLRWSFGPNQLWRSSDEPFRISYGRCSRAPLDFRSECVLALKNIARKASLPLGILFSGGVDSELICRSSQDAGIPFTALIVRFKNDLNVHDTDYAVSICQQKGWKFEWIDFDPVDWMENHMHDFVDKYDLTHPEFSIHMKMLELAAQKDFLPIDGRGDICLVNEDNEIIWYETEEALMPTRYMMELGYEAIPRFFKYSPELIYSWLTDPMMKKWVRYNLPLQMKRSHDFKTIIYSQYWEDLEPRPKYTGFEKILPLYRIHRDRIAKRRTIRPSQKRMVYADVLAEMALPAKRNSPLRDVEL